MFNQVNGKRQANSHQVHSHIAMRQWLEFAVKWGRLETKSRINIYKKLEAVFAVVAPPHPAFGKFVAYKAWKKIHRSCHSAGLREGRIFIVVWVRILTA